VYLPITKNHKRRKFSGSRRVCKNLIAKEELHPDEVNKMLRHPGDIKAFKV